MDCKNLIIGIFKKLTPNRKNLLLSPFHEEVLQAVHVLSPIQSSGIKIREYLERNMETEISTPKLYAALSRLENLDLIVSKKHHTSRKRWKRTYHPNRSGRGKRLDAKQPGRFVYS
jgi:DNA-binding PadR family transcriptional regulator